MADSPKEEGSPTEETLNVSEYSCGRPNTHIRVLEPGSTTNPSTVPLYLFCRHRQDTNIGAYLVSIINGVWNRIAFSEQDRGFIRIQELPSLHRTDEPTANEEETPASEEEQEIDQQI